MAKFKSGLMFVGVMSAALAACGGKSTSEAESPMPPAAEPPAETAPAPAAETTPADKPAEPAPAPVVEAPKPEPLADEQIVMVSDLANTAEVDQSKLAQAKAKDAKVKKFAAMIVQHHTQAKQKNTKLVTKLKIKPAESPLATQLKTDADTTLTSLKGAAAPDFDRVYIASQVDAHRKVLDALTNQLIPNAKDAELKALLEEMRKTVETHLKEAQDIQNGLTAAAPAPGTTGGTATGGTAAGTASTSTKK